MQHPERIMTSGDVQETQTASTERRLPVVLSRAGGSAICVSLSPSLDNMALLTA